MRMKDKMKGCKGKTISKGRMLKCGITSDGFNFENHRWYLSLGGKTISENSSEDGLNYFSDAINKTLDSVKRLGNSGFNPKNKTNSMVYSVGGKEMYSIVYVMGDNYIEVHEKMNSGLYDQINDTFSDNKDYLKSPLFENLYKKGGKSIEKQYVDSIDNAIKCKK